ncbi:MAG: selenocysteine-specific translation elongation factor [Vulcanimicrobiaceae bacterium]
MHVIGTAGHVDHGKSSLVLALKGTDPDRWAEERARGMTLDLGFAHLRYDDGVEAGIVDVPGHERFLHNMLAGAAGMELLLLVVAANEGCKPQTFEHLAILRYLSVARTLVVLSKADTLEAAQLPAAVEAVRAGLAGTMAAQAALFPVSTLTGEGLDALREGIHDALVALPTRALDAPAYLPVDRVFALSGHGTIVTGTLLQGAIEVSDVLLLSPLGREVRVRSLQVFGERRQRVEAGTRVAANLPEVETAEIARGAVLASRQLTPKNALDVSVQFVPAAPETSPRRTPVRAYLGTAELMGTLVCERARNGGVELPVGRERTARLHLRTSVVAYPGMPFVLRGMSPKDLLGGGSVLSAAHGCGMDDEAELPEAVALVAALRASGLPGATPAEAGAAANVREDRAAELCEQLAFEGRAVRLRKPPAYADASVVEETLERVRERLRAQERDAPWIAGMTSLALSRALDVPEGALGRVLASAVEDGGLVYRRGYYATAEFVPELTAEQREFFDRWLAGDPAQPLRPVPFAAVASQMRAARVAGLAQAFETLLADGVLVKVDDQLYRDAQIAEIRSLLEAALRRDGAIGPAAFRDLLETTRKYALPLLEWFDAAGVTLRSGDLRVLRGKKP